MSNSRSIPRRIFLAGAVGKALSLDTLWAQDTRRIAPGFESIESHTGVQVYKLVQANRDHFVHVIDPNHAQIHSHVDARPDRSVRHHTMEQWQQRVQQSRGDAIAISNGQFFGRGLAFSVKTDQPDYPWFDLHAGYADSTEFQGENEQCVFLHGPDAMMMRRKDGQPSLRTLPGAAMVTLDLVHADKQRNVARPRTCVAVDSEGRALLLSSQGCRQKTAADWLRGFGAEGPLGMLDGGGSTQLSGKIESPRPIPHVLSIHSGPAKSMMSPWSVDQMKGMLKRKWITNAEHANPQMPIASGEIDALLARAQRFDDPGETIFDKPTGGHVSLERFAVACERMGLFEDPDTRRVLLDIGSIDLSAEHRLAGPEELKILFGRMGIKLPDAPVRHCTMEQFVSALKQLKIAA